MIVVDTSVWIAFLRRGRADVVEELRQRLDEDEVALTEITRLELLGGASVADARTLRRTLAALPTFAPSADTWRLLDAWTDRAARAGQRFGVADLIIGALAAERGLALWSLDGDFARMADLGLLRCHRVAARRRQ